MAALIITAAFALLLVFGRNSPLSFLYTYSGFNNFRVPSRFLSLFTLTLAGLSGFGLDRFLAWYTRRKIGRIRSEVVWTIVCTIAALDLFFFSRSYHPLVPVQTALEAPESIRKIPVGARIFTYPDQGGVWDDSFFTSGFRDATPYLYYKNGMEANLNLLFERANVRSYSALLPVRLAAFGRVLPRLLNAAAVEYVISPSSLEAGDILTLATTVTPSRDDLPEYYVYRNTQTIARVRLVHKYKVATSAVDSVEFINEPGFDFADTVILETDPQKTLTPLTTEEVRILVDEEQRLVVSTDSDKEALLVVADSYFPGWQADVDGSPSEILPVNIN